MSLASLVLVLTTAMVGVPDAEPDANALVARLGSADPAEQTAAASALEALGREALPALRQAHESPDGDLRARASALWDQIQRGRLTRPSLVRLDNLDRPVPEIVASLRTQTGLPLAAGPVEPQWASNHDHGPDPVPFWEAVDRLGLKGARFINQNPAEGKFPNLELSSRPEWALTSSSGPFRIALADLHLHRDITLMDGPWVEIDRFAQRMDVPRVPPGTVGKNETLRFFGGLQLMVEPRMWFTQEAPARLTEATDDLGQSLVPDADGPETKGQRGAHFTAYAGSGVTNARTEFLLKPPDHMGRVARLRGVVPVMLHLRRPDPTLVIPLADAAGKTFRCDDAEFTVRSVTHSPTGTTVAVTVRLHVETADLPENPDPQLVTTRLQMLGMHQLELINAEGTILVDHAGSGGGGKTPEVYQWTISNFQNGQATHLRYFSMLRARYDAVFKFQDVPLP